MGAIGSAGSSGVTSKADFEAINAALGRAIASVPESKVMDVYNSFSGLVSSDVPSYLMSTVKEADAKAAYAALMDFKDVVKAHPITASTPASSVSTSAASNIGAALVTSQSDFEAINAGLGKAIASVPTSKVMDVYNAFAGILSPVIPNYLFSSVNPGDAQ